MIFLTGLLLANSTETVKPLFQSDSIRSLNILDYALV